jgi:hypothetical protein
MVRTYKRKTDRGKYGTEALKDALEAVLSGTGLKTAARQYGIPAKTLRRHRDGKVSQPGIVKLGNVISGLLRSFSKSQRKRSRKRRAESAILTSSPYKKI